MKTMKCKVCGKRFVPEKSMRYTARDCNAVGLSSLVGVEVSTYDAYDCPKCGAQNITNERKRRYDYDTVKEHADD